MVRIINRENIPENRKYKANDDYKDINHDLRVSPEVVKDLKPFTHERFLYSPEEYNTINHYAICRKREVGKDVDANFCANITCPFCGYEILNGWLDSRGEGETVCPGCNSEFSYQRDVKITYSSSKIKEGIVPEV